MTQVLAPNIVMTGVSGFVGSAIAAGMVLSGAKTLRSLAPDDADGAKAHLAVARALEGFGENPSLADMIEPVQLELSDTQAIQALNLSDVDQFWHVAAHMSYAPQDFTITFDFNVNASVRLMRRMNPKGRFFFISTTGVAGPGDREESDSGKIPESLLTDFEPLNPYTISKQMAELALAQTAKTAGVGLTILRLGSVIGHSRTGWSNATRYGYYSYLQAFKRYLGRKDSIEVGIQPQRHFPLIHIDHLVELCQALAVSEICEPVEVFHVCNQDLPSVAEHFARFEAVTNHRLKIGFGEGRTTANRAFNRLNADNNRFMGTCHVFAMEKLAAKLGEDHMPPAVSGSSLDAVFRWYLAQEQ